MIRSYRCKDTERLANNYRVRRFASVERVARRKLALLDAAATLSFLRVPPGIGSRRCEESAAVGTVPGSTINGGSVSGFLKETPTMSR